MTPPLRSALFAFALNLIVPGLAQAAEAPGITDKEILIGQTAAQTGPAADLGRDVRLGIEAYFKEVNAKGGVNGRQLRLVSLDDGYDPERAAANARQLIEKDKVFAMLGNVGTATGLAVLPLINEAKVPLVGPYSGAESLRGPESSLIFHVRASYADEAQAIIKSIANPAGRRLAVFYQNDAFGKSGLADVEKELKRLNVALVAKATVERNSTDVAAAVDAITKANADGVIMMSAYKSCAAFVREMHKRDPQSFTQYWAVSFVGGKALAAELGQDARGVAVSQVVPFPWGDVIPVVREHAKAMPADAVSFATLEGFIDAKVLVEGLKKAGRNPTREGLVQALGSAGKIDVGGFAVQFAPNDHKGSHYVDLTMIGRGGFIH
ncbi:ABC transporter substrate-binding protein [Niveibacterium umoris]|uniref:ABC-type branched-subunit amino acid transport system substrate-binding protein n=1 Tax=Niveibacterium umoris TaxID=1193620 RepID=A0A840BT82_9RHOO|nr:ABC transporter substrate-binding protein [Niveibacterium umoris]MBB4013567.1 ABC-type branched-subunit amino acid transport system substrate-binding protein [Niveibacterium umoris]